MTAHRTLKAYRKAHQLSQRAAAQKFTITQAEWCRIERGERCPRPKLAQRISNRTGVPLKTLLGL